MKKITTGLLAFFILFYFTGSAFAQTKYLSGRSIKVVGVLDSVKYSLNENSERIFININKYSDYSILRLKNPERVAIDIYGVGAPGKQQIINVKSKNIKAIRYAQFDVGISRVVLDVVEQPNVKVIKEAGGLVVVVNSTDKTDFDNSRDEERKKIDRDGDSREQVSRESDLFVEHLVTDKEEKVNITMGDKKSFNVMRLTGPDRIIIDFPNSSIDGDQKEIAINSSLVKSIRYAQFSEDVVRVVLDTEGQVQYDISESQGILSLNLKTPNYNNLRYYNHSDRVHFILDGAKLTEGGTILKNLYSSKYDGLDGKKFTITFPTDLANLGAGNLNIDDSYLQSIEIIEDKTSGNTSMVFNAKGKYEYVIFTRPETKDTAITIVKPATKHEKLVIVDAGHGGSEPGAIYGNLMEKDINLDISIKLNNLLNKNNIKTYMIREEDIFVSYYERACIANALNAGLFLSVHNNAMVNKDFDGTMTLFYPQKNSITGSVRKIFADNIQKRLLENLKTTDRKIRERDDLIVLKNTKMPAVLAEIAFMTNAKDRNNLKDEDFKNRAAQGLYEGIIATLSEIK